MVRVWPVGARLYGGRVIIFYVLLGLVIIRVAALILAIVVLARPVRACPACFAETVPIRTGWLRLFRHQIELRWCAQCGWQGIARRERHSVWRLPTQQSDESRRVQGTS
jgi:hypothetical protein